MKGFQLTPHSTMCIMGFSYIASSSVIAPILSIYLKEVIEAPLAMIGLVTSTFFIVSAMAKFILGLFAGGIRTITGVFLAFIIFSICPILYPLTDSIMLLIAIRAIQGFAYAFIGSASLILAALTISRVERDKGVGTYTAFLSLGFLAGPAITTFSISLFGVAKTFYFSGLMGFIGLFAASVLYRKMSHIERSWQIIGVSVDRESLANKIKAIFKNKMFGTSLIGSFSFYLLFGVILAYAPLYAKERLNFSDNLVSIIFLLYYIATTITRISIGRIVGKISKQKLMIVGVGFATLLPIFLAFVKYDIFFAGIFASIGAVQGIIFPIGSMLIAEYAQPSRKALASSLYMMGGDLGGGIAPLITANVVVQYGLEYGFIVSAVISATATVFIIWLNIKKNSI